MKKAPTGVWADPYAINTEEAEVENQKGTPGPGIDLNDIGVGVGGTPGTDKPPQESTPVNDVQSPAPVN